MPKLYLVGVTEDRTGIVLARSPRAKKGDSVLEVDPMVMEAIAEIRRFRAEGVSKPSVSSPALPSRRATAGQVSTPSALTPREMQARLRRGESAQAVARRAGVEEWRIQSYAAPILAEQARVVARARELTLTKRGAGPSGRTLGEAVQVNIIEKRVPLNSAEFEDGWSAYEPEPDRWVVRFEYVSRGSRQRAEWIYDPETESITAANRLATVIGWRDPRRTGRLTPLPEAPRVQVAASRRTSRKKSARKPATRRTGARRTTAPRPPTRKPATRAKKSQAKKPASARKPAAKKAATARKPPAARKPAPKGAGRSTKAKAKPTKASTAGTHQPRHLRIVEPPPDVETNWRTVQAPIEDVAAPYTRRHWREEVGRDQASRDRDLEPPSWLERKARPRPTVTDEPAEKPAGKPAAKPAAKLVDVERVARLPRGERPTRAVKLDADRVAPAPKRRSLRRRDRPLRAR